MPPISRAKWSRGDARILVYAKDGSQAWETVKADILGTMAVHRMHDRCPGVKGWALTHLPSGLAMSFKSWDRKDEAKRVAEWCWKHCRAACREKNASRSAEMFVAAGFLRRLRNEEETWNGPPSEDADARQDQT